MKENETTIAPASRAEWREWLQENHITKNSVWLLYYKVKSGIPTISYSDAVDEALCFGWIDSKAKSVDVVSYIQYFTKRKPKSVWSKINKGKIVRLIEQGLMTPAGLESINIAKQNGSWLSLDDVEELVVPADLAEKLNNHPAAALAFEKLSPSGKRLLLQHLVLAKRPETRQKRIDEIIERCISRNVTG